MKPFERVILSCDRNPKFLDFWPLVRRAWERMFNVQVYLMLIDSTFQRPLSENVFQFPIIKGVPVANQAKIARYWLASTMAEVPGFPGATMTNDMDLLPLNRQYVLNLLSDRPADTLFTLGSELYTGPEEGKFMAGYLTAEPHVWRSLVNPEKLSWEDWVKSFVGLKKFDDKEDIASQIPAGDPNGFSDESLMRYFLWKNPVPVFHKRMPFWPYTDGALDRSNWMFDPLKFRDGVYKEAHMLRPYSEHIEELRPLVEYIQLL